MSATFVGGLEIGKMNTEIHIGKLILKKLDEQERSIAWLAKRVRYSNSGLCKILKRDHLDTELLVKISQALKHDLFIYYSTQYQRIAI